MEVDLADPYKQIERHILIMGEMAERNTHAAVMALVDRDNEMAADAIAYDREIDEVEVALDQLCIEILDRMHPTGEKLRLVVGAMKICSCLERISDLAVEIAERVLVLTSKRSVLKAALVGDFTEMLECSTGMLRDSIEAMQNQDVKLAWRLLSNSSTVTGNHEAIESALHQSARSDPKTAERVSHVVLALHALQRIAKQASNIAEEVIYIVTGNIVKHHLDEFRPPADDE